MCQCTPPLLDWEKDWKTGLKGQLLKLKKGINLFHTHTHPHVTTHTHTAAARASSTIQQSRLPQARGEAHTQGIVINPQHPRWRVRAEPLSATSQRESPPTRHFHRRNTSAGLCNILPVRAQRVEWWLAVRAPLSRFAMLIHTEC